MRHFLVFFLALSIFFSGCISPNETYTKVAPGVWRGALELVPLPPVKSKREVQLIRDMVREGELPFNFEVIYTNDTTFYVDILNGDERIHCTEIGFGRDRRTARDTFRIDFPEYQSYIIAEVRGALMNGQWIVTSKENYSIPFKAKSGIGHRFTNLREATPSNLTGNWATLFNINDSVPERAVAELKQEGNRLQGTFRTETGDYRYLDGTIQGNDFWMSCFDGSHAFLFSGKVQNDTLLGEFRSGTHHQALWMAYKDPDFHLGNPDSLVMAKQGGAAVRFTKINSLGKEITFPSPMFDQKIKVFTISGTWCPNCKDEQLFLTEFLKENPALAKQMEVVSFSFERGTDTLAIQSHLERYRQKLGIPYNLVYAGKASTAEAMKVFPMLSKVMAFPTMIIMDKKNNIVKVHTGFDGPATSMYHQFKQDFQATIEKCQ